MTAQQIDLIGLLGLPGAYFLLRDIAQTAKRGWFKDQYRETIHQDERPRMFALALVKEIVFAAMFALIGLVCAYRLLTGT